MAKGRRCSPLLEFDVRQTQYKHPQDLNAIFRSRLPPDSLLFPTREDVQDYLIRYSRDVRKLITFSTQVEDVSFSVESGHDRWSITTKSTITEEKSQKEYDAVVVANGHYSVPFIPSVPKIEAFNTAYPSIITHSKTFRSPNSFANKKVVVVGNAPSGLDIGNQISLVCKGSLLNSVREPVKQELKHKEEVPPIAEYLVDNRGVRFEDGRVEKDIDAIVYCTGYLYSYPFLNSIQPPIVTTGRRVIGLYQQLFHITHPTIAFLALPQKVIPFPISEVQGAALAKVWSNELALPAEEEMKSWEQKRVEELGEGVSFHIMGYPKDAQYINDLHDWVKTAENGFKKEPPYWDEKQKRTREVFAELRTKFGETGGKAKYMKDLGTEFADLDR